MTHDNVSMNLDLEAVKAVLKKEGEVAFIKGGIFALRNEAKNIRDNFDYKAQFDPVAKEADARARAISEYLENVATLLENDILKDYHASQTPDAIQDGD